MSNFEGRYAQTDDPNRKYQLLRQEMARLRGAANPADFFDPDEVAETVRESSTAIDGHLLVFAANDFGLPIALRPDGLDRTSQDEIRRAILENKYDSDNTDLDGIRCRILDEHPEIHKVIVAAYRDGSIRYHLPEGSNDDTNFLTVREMVGLVDYTTNSFQSDGLCGTY